MNFENKNILFKSNPHFDCCRPGSANIQDLCCSDIKHIKQIYPAPFQICGKL